MGAGSVPTLRKTGGALYHRLPEGNMPRRDKFRARDAFPATGGGPPRHGTPSAEIIPYSSLRSPSPAGQSPADTWDRGAGPPPPLGRVPAPSGHVQRSRWG